MLLRSEKIHSLFKIISFFTTKSKRTTTPRPFNNPALAKWGIIRKQPRDYGYTLPADLPNRNLYWNRTIQNKILRTQYNKRRLNRLKINPIHDSQGNRLFNRPIAEIAGELSSVQLIKQSVGRTIENLHEAIVRFPKQFVGTRSQSGEFIRGVEYESLKFAFQQLHDRHLTTMNLYRFCSYCQLRHMAGVKPTDALVIHFFRYLEAMAENQDNKIPLQRFGKMCRYFFNSKYSQDVHELLYRKKQQFELFKQMEVKRKTFQDIVPRLYTVEYLKSQNIEKNRLAKTLAGIKNVPGGKKLIQLLEANLK